MSVPASLSSTEDAIRLAAVALRSDNLLAIVEGDAKAIITIDGSHSPDDVLRLDELMLEAVDDHAHLVLATRRHTGPSIVLEAELAQWRRMQAEHRGRSLVLADWLVFLDDGVVLSLAELAGPPPPWH